MEFDKQLFRDLLVCVAVIGFVLGAVVWLLTH